ncbi:efflux RND transporter periplasmic adaptor subunit [Pacificitalea manganoxidans]|nr:efflux RND transporter periplasmic adaptor subunit [Pacificitalea manganoxidans]MDR6308285.1 RND family efflux transporter MFP subunit [Pacificitalea manganoxidans]
MTSLMPRLSPRLPSSLPDARRRARTGAHALLTACLMSLLALPLTAFPVAAQEAKTAEATPAEEPARPPRPAKLMTLTRGGAPLERQFFGRVRARETVDLAFQVGGQIVQFPAAEGAPVDDGQLIAQLDLVPFQRNLDQAQVNLDKARRDLQRLEKLSGSNVAEVQIRDAQTTVSLAEIALDTAEDQLEDATLTAPFDGLVARRMVAAYTTVSAGTPVVRLHDMSELRIDIDVPEVLFRRAQGGDDVQFTAMIPGGTGTYELVMREFEAETAEVAQTFTLTLAFVDTPPTALLPGASSTVTASVMSEGGDAVLLPETALVFDPDRTAHVMIFAPHEDDPDVGTVVRTPVQIEIGDNGRVVMQEGPEPGTEIVATGAAMLEDGQTVRRFTAIGK